jgi:hypothetical protein
MFTHVPMPDQTHCGILMDISSFVLLYLLQRIIRTFAKSLDLYSEPNNMLWESIIQLSLTMLELQ